MASIYAMAIAVSVFVTVLMLYTGFQGIGSGQDQAGATVRRSRWQNAHQDRAARQRANDDLHSEG